MPSNQATCTGGKDKGPTILRLRIRRVKGPYHEADLVSRVRELHLMKTLRLGHSESVIEAVAATQM
jgi:hypothetical protein